MIDVGIFYDKLVQKGTDFFTGVPDSLLKNFCAYLTDNVSSEKHIISANEGSAIALASGHHFATGKIPLIYMQNSGEGNMINPLLSLADPDVYSVPMLILIGWRGNPEVHDEPQHIKQGKVTCDLLDSMDVPYQILTTDESKLEEQINQAYYYMNKNSGPYAFVIKKGTFDDYQLKNNAYVDGEMTREESIEEIMLSASNDAIFVSTTGMASRELYELRDKYGMNHEKDFLTVGSMGHANQIALSIALEKPNRKVYCIDGDGATIMQMGGLATIGSQKPKNMVHIVLNNGSHDSVGGQPTVAREINLCAIAKGCGYEKAYSVSKLSELKNIFKNIGDELTFIEILVKKGARSDLGRPKTTPIENKNAFMKFLKEGVLE